MIKAANRGWTTGCFPGNGQVETDKVAFLILLLLLYCQGEKSISDLRIGDSLLTLDNNGLAVMTKVKLSVFLFVVFM